MFLSPIRNDPKKHINIILAPAGQSLKFVYVYVFLLSLISLLSRGIQLRGPARINNACFSWCLSLPFPKRKIRPGKEGKRPIKLQNCLWKREETLTHKTSSSLSCVTGRYHAVQFAHKHVLSTIVDKKDTLLIQKHFSACNQHVKFTFINSQEFHACISYMPAHMLGNDMQCKSHDNLMINNFK